MRSSGLLYPRSQVLSRVKARTFDLRNNMSTARRPLTETYNGSKTCEITKGIKAGKLY